MAERKLREIDSGKKTMERKAGKIKNGERLKLGEECRVKKNIKQLMKKLHFVSVFTGQMSQLHLIFFIVIRFSLINKRRDTKYVYTDLTNLET